MATGRKTGGRKKGTPNKRHSELRDRAAAEGITPLEVMLKAMRRHQDAGRHDAAAAVARDAAPYMHPRLQAVTHSGDADNPVRTINETVDRPPNETREQWSARRALELAARARAMGTAAGAAD